MQWVWASISRVEEITESVIPFVETDIREKKFLMKSLKTITLKVLYILQS